MDEFFDCAIADEVYELKGGDTAQGNALGTLAASARHIAVLTGTLLGGYADELFNILFRLGASRMLEEGFEYGEAGVRAFTEIYGLLEKFTVIEPADNACSEARVTTRVRHRPGASPLLFGHFLMSLGAFVSLEDISDALPTGRKWSAWRWISLCRRLTRIWNRTSRRPSASIEATSRSRASP
jgi:hypothetical protein